MPQSRQRMLNSIKISVLPIPDMLDQQPNSAKLVANVGIGTSRPSSNVCNKLCVTSPPSGDTQNYRSASYQSSKFH